MRPVAQLLPALLLIGACRSAAVEPTPEHAATSIPATQDLVETSADAQGAQTTPAPSTSAAYERPCDVHRVDDEKAMAIARALPEAAAQLRQPKMEIIVVERPGCHGLWYELAIGDPAEPRESQWVALRVRASDGAVEGRSVCDGAGFLSYAAWQREDRAFDLVWKLPELRGYDRALDQHSLGKVRRAVRLEGCPVSERPKDPYTFYVGEQHEDHTVRWKTVTVDSTSLEISITDLGGKTMPYARWAKTDEARAYAAAPTGKNARVR